MSHSKYEWLEVDDIQIEPWYVKSPCDDEAFKRLKESIEVHGFCSDRPIIVANYDGKLVLVAGYRRLLATPKGVSVHAHIIEVRNDGEAQKLYKDCLPV